MEQSREEKLKVLIGLLIDQGLERNMAEYFVEEAVKISADKIMVALQGLSGSGTELESKEHLLFIALQKLNPKDLYNLHL